MTFVDCQADLTGTVFSTENLVFARSFLTQIINEHDPSWLANPRGSLGALWSREDTDAVCRLIDIASILAFLSERIPHSSLGILQDKFNHEILRYKGEKFDETLTELQIASILADFASPIEFEPLVPKGMNGSRGNKPRSPDLCIRLPGGNVHIDATVFHVAALDEWDKSIQVIQDRISSVVRKKELLRSVELRFPLACKPSDLDKNFLRNLVRKITEEETGVEETIVSGRKAKVKWQPLLSITSTMNVLSELPASLEQLIPSEAPAAVISSDISGIHSAVHFEWDLLKKEQNGDDEILYRSLCNSLRGKRKQFSRNTQNLIAVKLGHHKLVTEAFIHMLENKMWTNDDFRFLTGLILFKPRQGYQKSDPGNLMALSVNPKAYCPASHALVLMFERQKKYHGEPESVMAYNNLGKNYESQGDIENAIRNYRKSLALNPNQCVIRNIVGILLANQGNLQSAISEFHEATICNPGFAAAHRNLGIAYARSGEHTASISAFKTSLAINPTELETLNNLGVAYSKIGDHAKAISTYEKALTIDLKYVPAYINMGISQGELGKMDVAIANFEKALQINPESREAKENLAEANYRLSKADAKTS